MTYSNFQFIKPLSFDRYSPSGALTRYIIFPEGDNRTAVIMTLRVEDGGEVPRHKKNDWFTTSCDSEEEFVSRFGRPLFDLIVAEYDKLREERLSISQFIRETASFYNIPFSITSEGTIPFDTPELVWGAKFDFVQNLHRLNNVQDHMYGMERAKDAFSRYKNEIEKEFGAFIVVNEQYVKNILEVIKPIYEEYKGCQTMYLSFNVLIPNDDKYRGEANFLKHIGTHKTVEVKTLIEIFDTFLENIKAVGENETVASIMSLKLSHNMCHEAIRVFKLFEQE